MVRPGKRSNKEKTAKLTWVQKSNIELKLDEKAEELEGLFPSNSSVVLVVYHYKQCSDKITDLFRTRTWEYGATIVQSYIGSKNSTGTFKAS